jgi:hypothetical protein
MLGEPGQWKNGLETLRGGLNALEEIAGRSEALAVCDLLDAASKAKSVESIADLQTQFKDVRALPSAALLGLSDLSSVYEKGAEIAANLISYQEATRTAEERMDDLTQAQTKLDKLNAKITDENAFLDPERSMLREIIGGWLDAVKKARSTEGQAKQLWERIQAAPASLLTEIGDVVAHREDASETLTELHVLCTRGGARCATGMAEVVQGYQLVLAPGQWEAGLRSLLAGLSALRGVERQSEALIFCRLLNVASTANSVARIAAMQSQIKEAQAMASVALPGLSDLKPVLPQWLKIADNLESFQKASIIEEKVSCLGYAVVDLGRLNDDVRKTAREPERAMLVEIAIRWLETVNNALDDQRGRADLRPSVPTQRVLALDNVTVALALRNEGRAEAKNVKVDLMPSEQYQILEGDGRVAGAIATGQSKSVEFHVRPLADQGFRAEFQISYDDQRGTGRSFSFADQVSLVQVTQAYQPIPNPYYAGVGLPTGSPLFFGREDVFAFIVENIARPTLENVVLLLTGQRRCGKTSLLKQLPLKLDKRYVPVYIDGQQLGIDPGMTNLFFALSRVIAESLTATGVKVAAPTRESFEPAPSQVFELQFLAEAKAALGERRMLLAFDEFEELEMRVRRGNLDPTIFPFLRHLMQHSEKLAFIFVGTHKLQELTKDYWSIFFNIAQHKQIRFLDDATASRLIREPVAGYGMVYDDLAVERILRITAGHPYFVQLMCQTLVNFANENQRNFITADDLRGVLDETFALGEAHFESYWTLASPKERLVLAALTSLLEDPVAVTGSAISSKLAEYRCQMDPTEVSEILRGLAAQDIVEESSERTTLLYQFKLGIIYQWIRRNRSLARTVEDEMVRGPQETPTTQTVGTGS